jgi:hypothetical protein
MKEENENETETIDRTHEAVLEKLQDAISELLPKCDDKAADAIVVRVNAISWHAVRIGWILRDVEKQLKEDGTIEYEEWIRKNFKKKLSIERAAQFVKLSRKYQVDAEYLALRDEFGLDPNLAEGTSKLTLDEQLAQGGYTRPLKGVGVLPAKVQSENGDEEQRVPKTALEKVVASLRRSLAVYSKFRSELGADWAMADPAIDHLRTVLREIAPEESPELIRQVSPEMDR